MTRADERRARRDAVIHQLDVLERVADPELERIARLAAALTGAPYAGIHVVDREHQHRLAGVRAPLDTWPASDTLCRIVVDGEEAVETDDATKDERFAYSSLVSGDAPVRYYASAPIITPAGGAIGAVCVWDTIARIGGATHLPILADLAALVTNHLEATHSAKILAEAAMTDPLTGLGNRRLIYDAIEMALARRARDAVAVNVAVIDLVGFKKINDTLGHETGDALLAEVAERLRRTARRDDVIGRLGGDEFVVVLVGEEAADRGPERYAAAIAEPIDTDQGLVTITASVGIATVDDGDTPDSVLRRADLRMYEDKARVS